METIDVLKAARELISDESRWTQQAMARDVSGKHVFSYDARATRWCSMGAINKASGFTGDRIPDAAMEASLAIGRVVFDVVKFNDSSRHAEVLAAFDRAIELEASK